VNVGNIRPSEVINISFYHCSVGSTGGHLCESSKSGVMHLIITQCLASHFNST
jgi:hypothetical protein